MEHPVECQAPQPGTWLQVSQLDEWIEEDVAIGDKLYFLAISPLGLFHCYLPKRHGPFWIDPKNVAVVTEPATTRTLEEEIPASYRVH